MKKNLKVCALIMLLGISTVELFAGAKDMEHNDMPASGEQAVEDQTQDSVQESQEEISADDVEALSKDQTTLKKRNDGESLELEEVSAEESADLEQENL